MNENKQCYLTNAINSITAIQLQKLSFILLFLSGLLFLPNQDAKSEKLFLNSP